jgi:hypothetical protein
MWLRQQAVIPLRDKEYVLVILTTSADDRTTAQDAFGHMLDSFRILRTQMQQDQLDRALDRGASFMRTAAANDKGISARLNPVTYLRTTQDGNPIGFIEVLENATRIDRKEGLHIVQRAWLFNPDSSVQYVQEDRFIADDLSYDEWVNFSQTMPSKQVDPKQQLLVSIEGGIRDHNQLVVSSSNRIGATEKQEKAIEVGRNYASPAWPLLLPRMVDLDTPELYAFAMYDSDRRGLILQVLRLMGPTQISIGGRRVSAFRIENGEGLVPPVSTIDVDKNGRLLRLSSGTVEMTATPKEQINSEFGPQVKATQDHFREIAGLPPLKSLPNAGVAPVNPPAANQAPAERPRTRPPATRNPTRRTNPPKPSR